MTGRNLGSSILTLCCLPLILCMFLTSLRGQSGRSGANEPFEAELFEEIPESWLGSGSFKDLTPTLTWTTPAIGVVTIPGKLAPTGQTMHRAKPFAIRIHGEVELPEGEYEFCLRSRMNAHFYIEDQLILQSEPPAPKKLTKEEIAAQEAEDKKAREEAAQKVADQQAREGLLRIRLEEASLVANEETQAAVKAEIERILRESKEKSDTKPPGPIEEKKTSVFLKSKLYQLRLEFTGETLDREVTVVYRRNKGDLSLLTTGQIVPFTERGWAGWLAAEERSIEQKLKAIRQSRQAKWEEYWNKRHSAPAATAKLETGAAYLKLPAEMPQFNKIDGYIGEKLVAHQVPSGPLTNDYEFIRRVYLDVWGLIPTSEEVRQFVEDKHSSKRERLIDRLLADDRWADPWVAYWEDVLAENPKIYGNVPNSTGAFKDWIYRSFVSDRGFDRFATELVLMEGTAKEAGTLGFRESLGADVPLAEKALIIAEAFMGANMKCARCHDSLSNDYTQRDLFGLAGMLQGGPVRIPETSSVGVVPGRRPPAIPVTSKPGDLIAPSFVFEKVGKDGLSHGDDRRYRETLADLLISNERFASVAVNRIWKRIIGTGLVEPVDDWGSDPKISHPALMKYLVQEFVASGYRVKRIEELILKSHVYQRKRVPELARLTDSAGLPLFAASAARRMGAEEIVDSLHRAVGREFKTERMAYQDVDYGYPKRLWQVVTLSNEEDHDIFARPLLQEVIALGNAFGWRDQRPDPITVRNSDPNPLQPLSIMNGGLLNRLTKLTDESHFTALSCSDVSLNEFINSLLLGTLSRLPRARERDWIQRELEPLWDGRLGVAHLANQLGTKEPIRELTYMADAFTARAYIAKIREGEPPARRLTEPYRKKVEEILWVLFNVPEFVFVP